MDMWSIAIDVYGDLIESYEKTRRMLFIYSRSQKTPLIYRSDDKLLKLAHVSEHNARWAREDDWGKVILVQRSP